MSKRIARILNIYADVWHNEFENCGYIIDQFISDIILKLNGNIAYHESILTTRQSKRRLSKRG